MKFELVTDMWFKRNRVENLKFYIFFAKTFETKSCAKFHDCFWEYVGNVYFIQLNLYV